MFQCIPIKIRLLRRSGIFASIKIRLLRRSRIFVSIKIRLLRRSMTSSSREPLFSSSHSRETLNSVLAHAHADTRAQTYNWYQWGRADKMGEKKPANLSAGGSGYYLDHAVLNAAIALSSFARSAVGSLPLDLALMQRWRIISN